MTDDERELLLTLAKCLLIKDFASFEAKLRNEKDLPSGVRIVALMKSVDPQYSLPLWALPSSWERDVP